MDLPVVAATASTVPPAAASSATSMAVLVEAEVGLVDQERVGTRTETPSDLATDCFDEASVPACELSRPQIATMTLHWSAVHTYGHCKRSSMYKSNSERLAETPMPLCQYYRRRLPQQDLAARWVW